MYRRGGKSNAGQARREIPPTGLRRQSVRRKPGRGEAEKALRKGLASATRLGRLALRAVGWTTLFALVGTGLLTGYGLLAESHALALRRIEVSGNRRLGRLEVLRQADIENGAGLLELPIGRIEERLADHPWVERVKVSRRLPGTLRIRIWERRPRLLALCDGRFYALDGRLRAIAPQSGPLADLPVISGLSLADLVSPDQEAALLLKTARRLLALMTREDLGPGGALSEVRLDRVAGVSLVFSDLPATVLLGWRNFGPRLVRLRRVRADLTRRGEVERALFIDLDMPDRAVVRLRRGKS